MPSINPSTSRAIVEAVLGYTFNTPNLAWEAVQLAGSGETLIGGRTTVKGNERLAIVRDAFSRAFFSLEWYHSGADKGTWTTHYDQNLLSNENLGRVAKETGLVDALNHNPRNPVRNISTGLAATLLEALIGAVVLDGSEEDVKHVMDNLGIKIPK